MTLVILSVFLLASSLQNYFVQYYSQTLEDGEYIIHGNTCVLQHVKFREEFFIKQDGSWHCQSVGLSPRVQTVISQQLLLYSCKIWYKHSCVPPAHSYSSSLNINTFVIPLSICVQYVTPPCHKAFLNMWLILSNSYSSIRCKAEVGNI